ncbi:MAG: 7-carboxy-7-deazaguanine synthase QueE, partial [Bacteroidales bacterium]|nr:7-carboxy-7-deazaguanine synthase QueE [Bacteroidales bacterium]
HAAKRAHGDVQVKFVISSAQDEDEIKEYFYLTLRILKPSDIIVMPLGSTTGQLAQTSPIALAMALRNGWSFGPRLHISLFGNKEGT